MTVKSLTEKITDWTGADRRRPVCMVLISSVMFLLIAYSSIALNPAGSGHDDMHEFWFLWVKYFNTHSWAQAYDDLATTYMPINYPPAMPFFLFLVQGPVSAMLERGDMVSAALVIRLYTFIPHVMILCFLARKKDYGLLSFFAFFPGWIIITALWGQTDELFSFVMIFMIRALDDKKLIKAGALLAVSAVLKLQGAMLFVILVMGFFLSGKKISEWTRSLAVMTGIIYSVFLPFIIHTGDMLYPVKFYLSMAGSNYFNPTLTFADKVAKSENFIQIPEFIIYITQTSQYKIPRSTLKIQ